MSTSLPDGARVRSVVTKKSKFLFGRTGKIERSKYMSGLAWVRIDDRADDPIKHWRVLYHADQWEEIKEEK